MNVGQIYYPSNSNALRGLLIVVSKSGEWVCHFDIGQSECWVMRVLPIKRVGEKKQPWHKGWNIDWPWNSESKGS